MPILRLCQEKLRKSDDEGRVLPELCRPGYRHGLSALRSHALHRRRFHGSRHLQGWNISRVCRPSRATAFTPISPFPRARDIKRLFDLRKLSGFAISIYGHDAKTFVDITQSTEKVYRRLVYNLETLLPPQDSCGLFLPYIREWRRYAAATAKSPVCSTVRGRQELP